MRPIRISDPLRTEILSEWVTQNRYPEWVTQDRDPEWVTQDRDPEWVTDPDCRVTASQSVRPAAKSSTHRHKHAISTQ